MAEDYVFTAMSSATGGAGGYVNSPWRIVLHTTETNLRPSAWIPNFQYPSHVVCSFEHNEIFQLVGFNEAGKALYHAPGGVETNRMGAIQIEINGVADEAGSWSQEKLKWIGEKVLKPICDWIDANGGGFDCNNIPAPGAHGGSASDTAPQRLTPAAWTAFNGICGHRHVPDNDHYDPDQLNVPQIVAYANAGEGFLSELTPDEQRFMFNMVKDNHAVWFDGPNRWGQLWNAAAQVGAMLPLVQRLNLVTERANQDVYTAKSTGSGNGANFYDEIRAALKRPVTLTAADIKAIADALPDNVDEVALAKAVVKALGTELTN